MNEIFLYNKCQVTLIIWNWLVTVESAEETIFDYFINIQKFGKMSSALVDSRILSLLVSIFMVVPLEMVRIPANSI